MQEYPCSIEGILLQNHYRILTVFCFASGDSILAFELPPTWQAIHFDDVCNRVASGSRGWVEYYADSGTKFVQAQNIRFSRLRLDL